MPFKQPVGRGVRVEDDENPKFADDVISISPQVAIQISIFSSVSPFWQAV